MIEMVPAAGTTTSFEQLNTLCDSLLVPGTRIPTDAVVQLADGLLLRNFDSLKICSAALALLGSNPRIVEFVESALSGNTALLDRNFEDGTLIAFLNTPLMKALLRTTPIPSVPVERLLIYIRHQLLKCVIDPNWQPFEEALEAAVSMSIHSFLTEYIFPETPEESRLVERAQESLLNQVAGDPDLFSIAMIGAYRRLSSLPIAGNLDENHALALNILTEDLFRVQIAEPRTELELQGEMPPVTDIKNEVSLSVQAQYEENPYPRWTAHIDNDAVSPAQIFMGACSDVDIAAFGEPEKCSLLIAGCGTGRTAIEESLLWRSGELLAMDLSTASLAFGQRRAEELGLDHITFVQGDVLELAQLEPSFDYISCMGVLPHMADPLVGWKALVDVCRPGGIMRLGLYSARGRASVQHVRETLGDKVQLTSGVDIREAREDLVQQLLSGNASENLQHVFSRLDMYSTSMCRDLLFHVHEQDYTIPKIKDAIKSLNLKFCGFVDPTGALMAKYTAFAPADPMGLSLDSWDKFEASHPQTFVTMYDFMVQKPL